jgi:hypothetical protein
MSAITLRPDQLATFDKAAQEEFEVRALEFVREELPEPTAGISEPDLRTKCRTAVARAEKYGIEAETDVLLYFQAALMFGDDEFDAHPALPDVRELLTDRDMPADEKAERLYNRATLFDRAYRRGN